MLWDFSQRISYISEGALINIEDMTDGHSGFFLSLLNNIIKTEHELAEIIKHIARNSSFTAE